MQSRNVVKNDEEKNENETVLKEGVAEVVVIQLLRMHQVVINMVDSIDLVVESDEEIVVTVTENEKDFVNEKENNKEIEVVVEEVEMFIEEKMIVGKLISRLRIFHFILNPCISQFLMNVFVIDDIEVVVDKNE
jgi:hypothetical protein